MWLQKYKNYFNSSYQKLLPKEKVTKQLFIDECRINTLAVLLNSFNISFLAQTS